MLINLCVATLKCHCLLGSSDSKVSLDGWRWGGNKLCALMVNCMAYLFPSAQDVPVSLSVACCSQMPVNA